MHDYVLEIQSDSQALIANRGVSKELVEIIERGPSGLPGVDGAPGAPGTPGSAGPPGSNAWVIEANSSYPARPNVPSAVFIGPDSPEPYMLVGDTWINTSNTDPLVLQGNDAAIAGMASDPASLLTASLLSRFVRFVDDSSGAPLPSGKVTIKVNATTHEISDILWEA